jgi:2-haloacid dehalogenase
MPTPMPIPKNVTFVTFDVYGTLIDWETGIYDAFAKEAERDGFEIDRACCSRCSTRSPAKSRAAPTSSTRRCCGAPRSRSPNAWSGRWSPRARASCPTPCSAGSRSRRPTSSCEARQEIQTRPALEHRRQAARPDPPPHPDRLRPRRHRPAGALLQARTAHFTECARRMGGKRGWVHVAASHYHDVAPCVKQRVPVIWVNRNKETLDSSQKKPTAEVPNLARPPSCSASPERRAGGRPAARAT